MKMENKYLKEEKIYSKKIFDGKLDFYLIITESYDIKIKTDFTKDNFTTSRILWKNFLRNVKIKRLYGKNFKKATFKTFEEAKKRLPDFLKNIVENSAFMYVYGEDDVFRVIFEWLRKYIKSKYDMKEEKLLYFKILNFGHIRIEDLPYYGIVGKIKFLMYIINDEEFFKLIIKLNNKIKEICKVGGE